VGAVARVLGLEDTRLHDLRLATSELVTVAIESGSSEIEITVEQDRNGPLLRFSADGSTPAIPEATQSLLSTLLGSDAWSTSDSWSIRLIATTN
jgi:hypothetical protein